MIETRDGIIAINGRLDAFDGLKGFTKWYDLPRLRAIDDSERQRLDTLFDLFLIISAEADARRVDVLRAEHVDDLTTRAMRLMAWQGFPQPVPPAAAVRAHVLWTLAVIESEGRPRWWLSPELEPARTRLPSARPAGSI